MKTVAEVSEEMSTRARKAASDTVKERMDDIYNSIADTLAQLSTTPKAKSMTGPEAMLHCAKLIRRS